MNVSHLKLLIESIKPKIKIEEILHASPSKACALLEEFYKDNEELTEQDTSSFDRKQAERLCDLLHKVSNIHHLY